MKYRLVSSQYIIQHLQYAKNQPFLGACYTCNSLTFINGFRELFLSVYVEITSNTEQSFRAYN